MIIFLVNIQCQLYLLLIIYETSILYIVKKFCTSLKEHVANVTSFFKKKSTVNKKITKMASGRESVLHLWKNILQKDF